MTQLSHAERRVAARDWGGGQRREGRGRGKRSRKGWRRDCGMNMVEVTNHFLKEKDKSPRNTGCIFCFLLYCAHTHFQHYRF